MRLAEHQHRGQDLYSLTPQRSLKNGEAARRKTDSLNDDDALATAELLREAYAWIKNAKRADAKARRESQQAA